ncbi:MAG: hypothetical protein CSA34_01130 [Desulfobulbus propionicus]|nr:MAG: hypothetical protein CSA34_01130 [Desulfobulbus propionicus]
MTCHFFDVAVLPVEKIMNKNMVLLRQYIVLLIGVLFVCWPEKGNAWQGKVTRVRDGDSLTIEQAGRSREVRLYGIDAPEYDQPFSARARSRLNGLVWRRRVVVRPMDHDHYGRVVALVSVDGMLVNRELVAAGLAWVYPRYCKEKPLCQELAGLEQEARQRGIGVWASDSSVAPWVWKRRRR